VKAINYINNKINLLAGKWGRKVPRTKAGVVGYWLLMQLLVLIPEILLAMPLIIACTAFVLNNNGMAMGDPDGMTSTFPVILTVVALITLIVIALIQWWVIATIKIGRKR